MRVQFLLIISIFISFSQAETTLRIRLNRKSFAFMASVLEGVLQNGKTQLSIPSGYTVPVGSGSADIQKISVESFISPDANFSPVAPNGLALSTTGGSVTLGGSWNATYTFLWTMHLSGDLSFKMDGIKAFIRVNLVSRKRRLQIDLKECRLKIGSADLTLYGGIGAWIANHFVSGIKQDIKKSVQKVVCEDLRIGLSSLNENLWSLENEIDLNANTHLSFELLKDAKVTKNFIQFDFSASASFGESKCYLQSKGIDISDNDSNISNHMAVVWVDESAINCYLKTWYDTVDHPLYIKNIPNTKQFYLNCIEANNCTEGELNNLDMDMDNRNELVELIDADIFLIGEPVLRVDNRIYIETKMETILHRSQKDSNKLDSTKFTIYTKSLLNMTVSGRRIDVRTENLTVTISEEDSFGADNFVIMESLKYAAEFTLKELNLWEGTVNVPKLALPRIALASNFTFIGMDNFIRADVDFTLISLPTNVDLISDNLLTDFTH